MVLTTSVGTRDLLTLSETLGWWGYVNLAVVLDAGQTNPSCQGTGST
jgi:hypothetical protein